MPNQINSSWIAMAFWLLSDPKTRDRSAEPSRLKWKRTIREANKSTAIRKTYTILRYMTTQILCAHSCLTFITVSFRNTIKSIKSLYNGLTACQQSHINHPQNNGPIQSRTSRSRPAQIETFCKYIYR